MSEPLLDDLARDEGMRLKPYRDTAGKLTIGVGRNLDDVGISEAEAMMLLADDVARTDAALKAKLPWVFSLDDVRRDVLREMAFNLGVAGLQQFGKTLGFVQAHDWPSAAGAMLASSWAGQVHARADRLAAMMRTGARA